MTIAKPGRIRYWPDDRPIPEGYARIDGDVPGPSGTDPKDKKIADLEAAVAAIDTRLKDVEKK